MREFGVPALTGIPASARLTDTVFRRAGAEPGAVVLRRRTGAGDWQDVTAAEFRAEVDALAGGLMAAGIGPGDRVALMSRTRYEWTLIDYACWAAGAVTVPVYETSSAEQVQWILSDSSARAVFAETGAHAEIISSVRGRLPGLEHLWMTGGLDVLVSGGAQTSAEQLEQRRTGRTATDLASIVYTSGTTGRPKGCELTHGNLLAVVRNAIGALPEIFEAPDCSTLLFLPLAHALARIVQVGCVESGAILGHWPDIRTLADGLPEFRPTFLIAVPRVFEKVYESAQLQAAASKATTRVFAAAADTAIAWSKAGDGAGPALRLRHALFGRLVYRRLRDAVGGRMHYAISGGAPLGERLGHFFHGAGITVLEGYGMTETTGPATMNRPGRNKVGTVGRRTAGGPHRRRAHAAHRSRALARSHRAHAAGFRRRADAQRAHHRARGRPGAARDRARRAGGFLLGRVLHGRGRDRRGAAAHTAQHRRQPDAHRAARAAAAHGRGYPRAAAARYRRRLRRAGRGHRGAYERIARHHRARGAGAAHDR
jgi:long-chain acyl-CoA synthetase